MNFFNHFYESKPLCIGFVVMFSVFFLLSCNQKQAREESKEEPLNIRLAHTNAPGNSVTLGYEKFKELVEEKSDGSITIQIFPGNTLGTSDRVVVESAQQGSVEMASGATPNLANFSTEFMALDLPYITRLEFQENLYNSFDNGQLGEYYTTVINEMGLQPIMFSEYGYRNYVSVSRPLSGPEDLSGLKIRTTDSPVEIKVASLLGMNPVPIGWGEVYTALQQKTIDAEGNTFSLLNDAKHTEVLKYAMDSRHNYSMHIGMMNKYFYDSLSAQQKEIISEAASEALKYQREITVDLEEKALEAFAQRGIEIHRLSEDQFQQLEDLTRPVWDEFADEISPMVIELIQETQGADYIMQ